LSPDPDVRLAWTYARAYLRKGLAPLPSRADDKRPDLDEFAGLRSSGVTEAFLAGVWKAPNLQILTGANVNTPTRILVVDCDSDRAREVWRSMLAAHGLPPSPWVVKSPSGGRHTYFRIPDGVTEVPSRLLWGLWDTYGPDGRGRWVKHHEVRILGDGALVVAPPSIHVDFRDPPRRYEFLPGFSPKEKPWLSDAPAWLLDLPGLATPNVRPKPAEPPRPEFRPPRTLPHGTWDRDVVLAALGPDQKVQIARAWGLRFVAGSPNAHGWVSCHAIGREDRHPSGSFHTGSGVYQDRRDGQSLSFWDLAVTLGAFRIWQEAVDWVAAQRGLNPYRAAAGLGTRRPGGPDGTSRGTRA
jgi:hypothetical protein